MRVGSSCTLANGEAERDVIARTPKPDCIFMSHLHRPIAGSWRGIPFHIQRALTHQVTFDFDAEGHIPGTVPTLIQTTIGGTKRARGFGPALFSSNE